VTIGTEKTIPALLSPNDLTLRKSFYERVLKSLNLGIIILDAKSLQIIEVNPFISKLTGFENDYFLGKNVLSLDFFENKQYTTDLFSALKKNGSLNQLKLKIKTNGQRRINVEFSAQLFSADNSEFIQCNIQQIAGQEIYDNQKLTNVVLNGQTVKCFVTNEDQNLPQQEQNISDKRSEYYLSDWQLAEIVHGMSESCFSLDADWHFTFVNDKTETLLHTSRENLLGKSIWKVFPQLLGTPFEKYYRKVMKERVPVAFEAFSTVADCWMEIRLFPSGDGLSAFLRNIQERKTIEFERQKFVSLAENSVEFVGMCDLQGIPFFINEAACRLVGLETLEQALKTSLTEFFFPEDQLFIRDEFLPKVESEGHAEVEIRFRHFQTGEAIWMIYNVFLIRDENDQSVGFATVSRDITERKKSENAFKEASQFNLQIINSVQQGVIVLDKNLHYLIWNQFLEEMTGVKSADMIGKYPLEVLPDLAEKGVIEKLERALKGEIIQHIEWEVYSNFTKKNRWISATYSPHYSSNGEILGVIVIVNDITDQKLTEQKILADKERLEKTAAASPSVIYSYNLSTEGKSSFLSMSPRIFEIVGKTAGMLLEDASGFFSMCNEEDLERLREAQQISAENLSPWNNIWRMNHPEKGEIWVEAYSSPMYEPDGSITWLGILNDITDRKLSEQKIIESEKRYRILFESNPLPMWVYDIKTLKFLAVNDAAIRHYGYSSQEFLSMTLKDIRPAEDVLLLMADVEKVDAKLGKPIVRRHLKKDGTVIDVEIVSHGLSFAGRLSRLVLANDITERKKSERIILELNETLEKKVVERTSELNAVNRELEAFSYSVSHDLRAPLRAMDGFSLALLEDYEDKLDDEGKNYLQRVRSASQKMAHLIDDLLTLSRMSRGELKRENVNLSNIVKEITDRLQENQPKSSVNLTIEDDIYAFVDERLLRVALENLLNNAWKFTSKKDSAEISFGQTNENGETIYFVRDNGAGFDMNYADKLFGAFQRLHTASEFEGTGIGLATVQRIINRHGGEIRAESEIEKVTTFYFKMVE
jgi:PAS domain S-box-containing protein